MRPIDGDGRGQRIVVQLAGPMRPTPSLAPVIAGLR